MLVAAADTEGPQAGLQHRHLQRAAARHSSNTTAAALQFLDVQLPPGAADAAVSAVARSLQHPSRLTCESELA